MFDWLRKQFTIPAFMSLIVICVVSAVTIQVQGTAIIQLQQGMVEVKKELQTLQQTVILLNQTGTTAFVQQSVRDQKDLELLQQRVKDVESFNTAISVISTRLGYMEDILRELKKRPQ